MPAGHGFGTALPIRFGWWPYASGCLERCSGWEQWLCWNQGRDCVELSQSNTEAASCSPPSVRLHGGPIVRNRILQVGGTAPVEVGLGGSVPRVASQPGSRKVGVALRLRVPRPCCSIDAARAASKASLFNELAAQQCAADGREMAGAQAVKLGDSFSGTLRTFAYFMASGTQYTLEGVDYLPLYGSEPSAIEQVFAIFANV